MKVQRHTESKQIYLRPKGVSVNDQMPQMKLQTIFVPFFEYVLISQTFYMQ
jgi:hypothetical protein